MSKSVPCLIGTPRTYTSDPSIEDRHLAQAVRELAQNTDVSLIYHHAAIIAAKETKNGE